MLQKLYEVDLFQGLPAEGFHDALSAALPPQRLPAGHTLFRQGEPAEACYALLGGSAHLIQQDLNGHEVVLGTISAGRVVGVTALLEEGAYSTGAQIAQPATVLGWTRSEIQRLAKKYPIILHNALRVAMARYVELQQSYQDLAFHSVSHRLARALVKLARAQPVQPDGSILITITREHLATMAVTTIFTASRLLSAWERQGIVASQRGAIAVRNLDALSALAAGDADSAAST